MLYICLFLPASISVLVSDKLKSEKRTFSELVIPYLGYTFIINLIMSVIYHFIYTGKINWYSSKLFTIDFTMQYLLISLVVAVSVSCFLFIVSKVMKINIVVKERHYVAEKNHKNLNTDNKKKR